MTSNPEEEEEDDEEEMARIEVTDEEVSNLKTYLAHLARAVDLGKAPKELLALEQQALARATTDSTDSTAQHRAPNGRPGAAMLKQRKLKPEPDKKKTLDQLKAEAADSGKGFTELVKCKELARVKHRSGQMRSQPETPVPGAERRFDVENLQQCSSYTLPNKVGLIRRNADIREARRKVVKARHLEKQEGQLGAKTMLVRSRNAAHEQSMMQRERASAAAGSQAQQQLFFPICADTSRLSCMGNALHYYRVTRKDREAKRHAVAVIVRCIRKKLRKKRLQMLKRALPKLFQCLREWIRRKLKARKVLAVQNIVAFLHASKSMGDVPSAVKRYLHRVRVIQRNWRNLSIKMKATLGVWDIQFDRFDAKARKHRLAKGMMVIEKTTANIKRHMEIRHRVFKDKLRKALKQVNVDRIKHVDLMRHWEREKRDFDALEGARTAMLTGSAADRITKEFRKPPSVPNLKLCLTKFELKDLYAQIESLERAAQRDDIKRAKAKFVADRR